MRVADRPFKAPSGLATFGGFVFGGVTCLRHYTTVQKRLSSANSPILTLNRGNSSQLRKIDPKSRQIEAFVSKTPDFCSLGSENNEKSPGTVFSAGAFAYVGAWHPVNLLWSANFWRLVGK